MTQTRVTAAQLDNVGQDGPVTSLHIEEIQAADAAAVVAAVGRVASTLEELVLVGQRWEDLQALGLAAAPRLRVLTLTRLRVPANVLAHPTLEALTLHECFVGSASAPVPELQVGAKLRSLSATDSNFFVEHLVVDGPSFAELSVHLDEDFAEQSFRKITLRGPGLAQVEHRTEWPTRLHFEGDLPALTAAQVWIQPGNYSRPTVDVSGLPEGHPLRGLPHQRS
jgi:hypothetical protein